MQTLKLRQLITYLAPYKVSILIGTLSLLIVNGLGVYIPLLIRDNVDSLRYSFNIHQVLKTAILIFVLYLGVKAVSAGIKAKKQF